MRSQAHYTTLGIEPIAVMHLNMSSEEFQGFIKGNIEKYTWRNKDQRLADYQKIQVYARWGELSMCTNQIDEEQALRDLIEAIPAGKYKAIYTTGRGGLWVAARVAYILNIPTVHTDRKPDMANEFVLWVDDIADTGGTIKDSEYDTAVLCKRYSCPLEPTYCGAVFHNDTYIRFKFQGEM